jgi:hypothetical protein
VALQVLLGLFERYPVAERPEHGARVHVAWASRHHQARQRREPHRGVDRPSCVHRGERCPRADVRGDKTGRRQRTPEQLGAARARPRVAEAVKTEAPNAELFAPAPRQRVDRRLLRERRVEARVEAGDLHEAGPSTAKLVDGRERRRVVQRSQVRQALECLVGLCVDHERLDELLAAVDDAMPDGVRLRRLVQKPLERVSESEVSCTSTRSIELLDSDQLVALPEKRELQAAGPCVHDEHAHAHTLPEAAGQAAGTRRLASLALSRRTVGPCQIEQLGDRLAQVAVPRRGRKVRGEKRDVGQAADGVP